MIRLEKFGKENYASLISWIDSEEALMEFGGPLFTFPLTPEQLDHSLSDPNRIVFCVVDDESNISIGHCEIYLTENSAKLGRILVGPQDQRGKGLGQQIVRLLLHHIFRDLGKPIADLNVFDWNTGAIRCYEKVGFTINPDKKLEREIKGETWIAINMVIDQQTFEQKLLQDQ